LRREIYSNPFSHEFPDKKCNNDKNSSRPISAHPQILKVPQSTTNQRPILNVNLLFVYPNRIINIFSIIHAQIPFFSGRKFSQFGIADIEHFLI
jgi:hypothetical protein